MAQTYFEVLGVSWSATDDDIEEAYQRHIETAGDLDNISDSVKKAYAILKPSGTRDFYLELLQNCKKGSSYVAPDEQDQFKRFCQSVGINFQEDPTARDYFVLWRHDQSPPRISPPPEAPRLPYSQSFAQRCWNFVKAVVFFQVFRGKSESQIAGLLAGYVVGLLGIFLLGSQFVSWFDALQANHLQTAIRTAAVDVSQDLQTLDQSEDHLRNEFQQVVRAPIDALHNTQEIDELILQEKTVAESLAILHSQRLSPDDSKSLHATISAVNERMSAGTFLPQDETLLENERTEVRKRLTSLASQERELDHIRVLLAAKRSDDPQKTSSKG